MNTHVWSSSTYCRITASAQRQTSFLNAVSLPSTHYQVNTRTTPIYMYVCIVSFCSDLMYIIADSRHCFIRNGINASQAIGLLYWPTDWQGQVLGEAITKFWRNCSIFQFCYAADRPHWDKIKIGSLTHSLTHWFTDSLDQPVGMQAHLKIGPV